MGSTETAAEYFRNLWVPGRWQEEFGILLLRQNLIFEVEVGKGRVSGSQGRRLLEVVKIGVIPRNGWSLNRHDFPHNR